MRKTLIAIALLLVPVLAFAQAQTTGSVTGIVLDEAGKPVAKASITLESPSLQGARKTTADDNGRFLAPLLPPGVYTMTANAPGKSPVQFTFRVGVGQTVPIDPVLKSGDAMMEEVTVYGAASKLETTAGGENFNFERQLDQLPVTNRDLMNVANLAPNVSFGPTGNNVAISGAPSYDNSVLLDGSDISDPYYSAGTVVYLEEAIEEVQIITNGASARYGRFQGGIINATTKSGGNTFDGTFRTDLNKQSWNSKTPFDEDQSDKLNKVYSATIGGPIMKEHLWFFVGARTIPATSLTNSQLVVPGSFTTTTNEDRYQLKLTGAINANHSISAGYLKFDRELKNTDPFAWVAEPNAIIRQRTDPRTFYTAEYQGILSETMFLNAQIAKKTVSIKSGGDPAKPSPILEYFNGEYRAYANGWFDPADPSVRDNESAALSMTNAIKTASWGDHTLEYGIQFVNSITAGDNRQTPTGYSLYYNTPNEGTTDSFATCDALGNCTYNMDPIAYTNWRLKHIPGAGDQKLKNTALYVQDAWEFSKWRFDLGLRWENWKGAAISPAMTLDFDEFSPRLGVTYNITPEWQAQVTWGKYVARFNDNVANGVTGISSIFGPGIMQELSPTFTPDPDATAAEVDAILRDDANWGTIIAFVDPRQPTTFFANDIKGPYAQDLNLSLKRALPGNQGVVTLTYSNRQFKQLLEDYRGGIGIVEVDLPDGSTNEVDRVVWDNCDTCRREYEAMTLGWDYRPSASWELGGNYTYSRTRGNYEGEASGQPSIGSIIGNYPNNVDASDAYPFGYLLSDVRHRARAWGNYRFDFGRAGQMSLGGIFFYRSGANFNKTGRVAAGSDPDYLGAPGTYVKYFGGRGNNRFDGFWNLDTTIRYDIPIWRDLKAYAKFDILNITDQDSLINSRTGGTIVTGPGGIADFQPNSSFGTATNQTSYQTPRSFFLSLGISW